MGVERVRRPLHLVEGEYQPLRGTDSGYLGVEGL